MAKTYASRPHSLKHGRILLCWYVYYLLSYIILHRELIEHLTIFTFAVGSGDKTICFHCGVALHDWMPGENVWEEHGTWSPFCVYVCFIKVPQFVEELPCVGEHLHLQTNFDNMFTTTHYVCLNIVNSLHGIVVVPALTILSTRPGIV